MKKIIANILKNGAVLTAFAAVCLTVYDFPCLPFIGEPEIPDSLLKRKENVK
ncbi:MAG: hypothetical protein Q4C52_11065 [Eubacteriales bacterium]|nr:hypothetical protein [Eubacteriales bacterium]